VQAARVFAQTAAYWSDSALLERAPELLRRWCSHRNFTVREAMACCMSLVSEQLPLQGWQSSLLPWFSQLCHDNNWRVRRAAALDLPRLAGALHRHQWRVHRTDSTSSCSTGDSDEQCSGAGACGSSSTAACCRISGVAVESLGVVPTGGCANLQSEPATGYGARPDTLRRRSVTALNGAAVWSVHVLKPAAQAAPSSGGARSMGKHPLSSSLLVDKPEEQEEEHEGQPASCETASSSLSSSDERPLAGSPTDMGESPLKAAEEGSRQDDCSAAAEGDADAAVGESAPEQQQSAAEPQPPCALFQQHPVLHACWAALRECLDCVTTDSSHWVKVTALNGLGPCLLALPACQLSGLLISRFVAMGSSTSVIYEISVALACAQSLGLVASRLGPHRWGDVRCAWLVGGRESLLSFGLSASCLLNACLISSNPTMPTDQTHTDLHPPTHPKPGPGSATCRRPATRRCSRSWWRRSP